MHWGGGSWLLASLANGIALHTRIPSPFPPLLLPNLHPALPHFCSGPGVWGGGGGGGGDGQVRKVELLGGYSRVMSMIEIEVEMDTEVPAAEVVGIQAQLERLVELEALQVGGGGGSGSGAAGGRGGAGGPGAVRHNCCSSGGERPVLTASAHLVPLHVSPSPFSPVSSRGRRRTGAHRPRRGTR